MKKLMTSLLLLLVTIISGRAQLLSDSFSYVNGPLAGNAGWSVFSGGGTAAITVASSKASIGATGEDISTIFTGTPITSGSLYYAITYNFSAVGTGDVFTGLSATTSAITGSRLYARTATGGLNISVTKNGSSGLTYGTGVLTLNTDHLFIVRYDFNTGSSTDDTVRVYVDPTNFVTEGSNTVYLTSSAGSDLASLSYFGFIQNGSTSGPTFKADDLVISTSFAGLFAVPEPSIYALFAGGFLMLATRLRRRR